MSSQQVIEITTEEQFKELIKEAVCIDFWAPWCGPCIGFASAFEEAAQNVQGVQFAKVNVDNLGNLAVEYKVKSIPTVLLFKGGELTDRHTGSMSSDALVDWISKP